MRSSIVLVNTNQRNNCVYKLCFFACVEYMAKSKSFFYIENQLMGRDALRKANLSQHLIYSINICRATSTSNQSSRAKSLHFIYVCRANFPYKTYAISASAEREPNGSHFHCTAVNYWTLTEVGSHFCLSIRELMPLKS